MIRGVPDHADAPSSLPSTSPPDWSRIGRDVICPLCEYNLRGLTEPRCPECGYRFEWHDVFNSDRYQHPFLFEHHPERNIWSFVRTLVGTLLPVRFWESVQPTLPLRARRLIIYWLLFA